MLESERQARSADLMLEIEAEMRRLGLWAGEAPTAEALSSPLPFCCDTLSFAEWLQFVFLPRMKIMLEVGAVLPSRCGIAPMAEESFRSSGLTTARLESLLSEVDETLAAGPDSPRSVLM